MMLSRNSIPQSRLDFEAAFEQHWAPLCRMVYRLTGDWSEAEDLALEALMQLYRHPPADANNLSGWLYRVATNLGLNALRARKRRQLYESEAGDLVLHSAQPDDPASSLEQQAERQRVRETLRSIKPRSAQVLILRYSELSYAEIAAALEVAPGSIGTMLARAEQEFEQAYKRLSD